MRLFLFVSDPVSIRYGTQHALLHNVCSLVQHLQFIIPVSSEFSFRSYSVPLSQFSSSL